MGLPDPSSGADVEPITAELAWRSRHKNESQGRARRTQVDCF